LTWTGSSAKGFCSSSPLSNKITASKLSEEVFALPVGGGQNQWDLAAGFVLLHTLNQAGKE